MQEWDGEGFYLCCAVLTEGWSIVWISLAAGHCPPAAEALQCTCFKARTEHPALQSH